ncbi:hypothetical protein H0A36_29185 [Endozoicomonas sp. SM1973]|uniref:Uncharacterized protein n=1 Tax=Spartinivicinus marinus TaxID=2994442 RepID=A0A853I9Y9_9GAMM|nr:hypothetical protein [Spartinivicinus marinus]MCX4027859.1 hypothetical protein [Spartinivicinus marinus]NYZ70093.1 hypothetical protein [Spartinivicinus marinus]
MAGILVIIIFIFEAYGVWFFKKLFFGTTAKKIIRTDLVKYVVFAVVVALILGFSSGIYSISRYENKQVYGLSFLFVSIILKDLQLIVPALVFHLLSWLKPNLWLCFIRDCFYLSLTSGLIFTLTCSNLVAEYFNVTLRS